jgi:uncharacterized protein
VPGTERSLRLNTVDLLHQPGARREIVARVAPTELGIDEPRLQGDLDVALVAESTIDGVLVTGSIGVTWDDECRRCLRELVRVEAVPVEELYQEHVSEPDAFELGAAALDLSPMVRDAVLLALAGPPPLCRPDCAGICPTCGADRNDVDCGCDTTVRDDRWAALDDLDLSD